MPHGLNFRLMRILGVFVIPAAVYAARTPTAATLVAIRSELTSGSVIWNGARIAGSTVAGTIDLDNKAAGVTQTRARAIVNDGSNVFVRPAPPR